VASKSPRGRPCRGFGWDGIPVRRSGPVSSREVGGIFKVPRWSYRWGTASGSPANAVAGRFAFPASSSTLTVAGRALEVFPCHPFSASGEFHLRFASVSAAFTLVIFSSSSERSRLCRNSSRPPKRSEFLLSWDSSACRPSAVLTPTRPLPEARAPFGPVVRATESRSALGVSHPPGGFLRVVAAGLLRPAAGFEVRCVSRCPPRLRRAWIEPPVPRNAVHPTKSSPRQQPFRITAAVASMLLPSFLRVARARVPEGTG